MKGFYMNIRYSIALFALLIAGNAAAASQVASVTAMMFFPEVVAIKANISKRNAILKEGAHKRAEMLKELGFSTNSTYQLAQAVFSDVVLAFKDTYFINLEWEKDILPILAKHGITRKPGFVGFLASLVNNYPHAPLAAVLNDSIRERYLKDYFQRKVTGTVRRDECWPYVHQALADHGIHEHVTVNTHTPHDNLDD